jgi:hypothetical protein
MSDHRSGLRWGFDIQTMGCKVMGSRFSADVLRIVIDDAEAFGPFVAIVAPWAGWSELEVIAAAAPLRLLGGLHDIVLRGKDTALATQYPPAEPDRVAWCAQLVEVARTHAAYLAGFIQSPPQTNEVCRSMCLVG